VKNLLRFLLTRDHMHQLQWLRAIQQLEEDGLDKVPVPEAFDLDNELEEFAHLYVHASDGAAALDGPWASGPAQDGGTFTTQQEPQAYGDRPTLPPGDPRLYGTPPADPQSLLQTVKEKLT
jgi:Mn-containing catalase